MPVKGDREDHIRNCHISKSGRCRQHIRKLGRSDFNWRENGTAEGLQETKLKLHDCKKDCTVSQEVSSAAFNVSALSGHSDQCPKRTSISADSTHHSH